MKWESQTEEAVAFIACGRYHLDAEGKRDQVREVRGLQLGLRGPRSLQVAFWKFNLHLRTQL